MKKTILLSAALLFVFTCFSQSKSAPSVKPSVTDSLTFKGAVKRDTVKVNVIIFSPSSDNQVYLKVIKGYVVDTKVAFPNANVPITTLVFDLNWRAISSGEIFDVRPYVEK